MQSGGSGTGPGCVEHPQLLKLEKSDSRLACKNKLTVKVARGTSNGRQERNKSEFIKRINRVLGGKKYKRCRCGDRRRAKAVTTAGMKEIELEGRLL